MLGSWSTHLSDPATDHPHHQCCFVRLHSLAITALSAELASNNPFRIFIQEKLGLLTKNCAMVCHFLLADSLRQECSLDTDGLL